MRDPPYKISCNLNSPSMEYEIVQYYTVHKRLKSKLKRVADQHFRKSDGNA